MAPSELFSNSLTVSTTELSVCTGVTYTSASPQTTDYTIQPSFDLGAMAAGDQFQLTIYEKVISSGTQRVKMQAVVTGAQGEGNFTFPALFVMHGWDVTMKKLAGTDRVIPASIKAV